MKRSALDFNAERAFVRTSVCTVQVERVSYKVCKSGHSILSHGKKITGIIDVTFCYDRICEDAL
jgi:hypothetical protein